MSKKYSEIVIEGNFMLAKGFLLGFLSETKPDSQYFLHRKSGIRRTTFSEMLKEFFELDNFVHFCLENELVKPFEKATELYTKVTGNKIKSVKEISSASFTFAYEFFNKEYAEVANHMLANLPEGVTLEDYFPYEEKDEEGKGVEAYAPLHSYTMRAKGRLTGDFEGIMDLYLQIKKSNLSESIMCSEVELKLD